MSAYINTVSHPAADLLQEGAEYLAVEQLQRSRAARARAAGQPREAAAREERADVLGLDAAWVFLLAWTHTPAAASC